MTPIRVLHLRNCRGITDVTGPENYLLSLMEKMNPQACQLFLACTVDPRHGETPWIQEAKQRQCPFTTIPVKHRCSWRDLTRVMRLINEFRADIVHTHDHRADVIGIAAAKLTRKAAVATFAGWTNWKADSSRGRFYAWLDRQALRHADVVLSDSATMAAEVTGGENGPPVLVIPNGVDLERFDPTLVNGRHRKRFGAEDGHLLLGMVGRIHPNKGQLDFLDVAARLSRTYPHCRFVIIGEAPPGYEDYKHQVLHVIRQKGLDQCVSMTKASRDEIPSVMASLDILVAPSHIESFSFSLIEAMAMEKSVVATNAGGTPELITHAEDGLLVRPGDLEALAAALSALIADSMLRARLGERARQKIKAHLSTDVMAAKTLCVYQEIVEWRKRGARLSAARSGLQERLQDALTSCATTERDP